MSSMIEAVNVWKKYQIHEFASLYKRAASWRHFAKEGLNSLRNQKRKNDFWALKDVSLEVKPGESLGVIGPNGAGKTTLLRLLGGITRPTRGHVKVRGRIGALISVGAGFHAELTGRENIYLNGAIMGMSKGDIKGKFDSIVDFAEIEDFLNTPLKRYSSGMIVRLGFSVAAHLEPDVLLVDEILSVGDIRFRQKSIKRMRELFRSGATIVFVSHGMRAVEQLCDHAILLHQGAKIQAGRSEDVISYYLTRFFVENQQAGTGEAWSGVVGLGPIHIDRYEFRDPTGRPLEELTFGHNVTIHLWSTILRKIESYVKYYVIFSSLDDIPIATLYSPAFEFVQPGKHTLACAVQQLPLLPGTYRLDLKMMVDGNMYEVTLGSVRVTTDITFSRTQNNFPELAHLRSYLAGQGLVFVPHTWESLKRVEHASS